MQEMDRSKQLVGILEKTSTKAAAAEEDQNENPGDLSVSECAINAASNGLSTSLASAELAGMGSELRDHQIEGIVADSSNYVSDSFGNSQIEVPDDSEDSRLADGHNEQYFPGSIVLSEGGSLEDSLKIDRLSSPAEFVPDVELGTGCLVDRLKEELYLSNFMKDIFQVQLSEQSALLKEFDDQRHHLVSEISILKASLHAALESNGCLAEELADCRYKLEAVDAMKEDLQNEVTAAKIQADEFSATVNELQLNLERSQGELSKLLIELSEAKCLVATLEEENQKLNGIIASETDERKKLVDDRESSLHENLKLLTELAVCKTLVADLQVENDKLHGDVSSLTDEKKKPVEDKESCLHELEVLSSELGESKTLVAVQGMENSYLKETVALMTGEKKRLEEEKESLTRENREVYKELDDCKVLMVALQADNANLSGSLSLVTEEKKKLEEEEEYIVHENNRLSSELLVLQEQLASKHVDMHIGKIRAIGNEEASISTGGLIPLYQPENSRGQVRNQENTTDDSDSCQSVKVLSPLLVRQLSDELSRGLLHELLEEEVLDDSSGFVVLKEHLEEAEKVLQNLEKAIERIHSHSSSLSRSGSKGAAPGVSKLIQAFESKVHSDEHEVGERDVVEDQSAASSFLSTKEHTENLRAVLKQLGLDAETAGLMFKGIRDWRTTANMTLRELQVQSDALKEHSYNLEATNIELEILYEAVKQHLCSVEAKNTELEVLCEVLKQRETDMRVQNVELSKKLSVYQLRVTEMQSQLDGLQQSSEEMASVMHEQLESLQKVGSERILMLEQAWSSFTAQIVETVARLDKSLPIISASTLATNSYDAMDINSCISVSVDAAIKMINYLQEKLEAACENHEAVRNSYGELNEKFNNLLGKNELAIGILYKIYGDLTKLLINSYGPMDKPNMEIQNEELSDPFDYSSYKIFMELLEKFLVERLQILTVNDKLKSELVNKAKDIEEFNRQGLGASGIQNLIEKIEDVMELEDAESILDRAPGSQLELLVSSLVEKYKEAGERVNLSREKLGLKDIELIEIQEKILKHENEILALRENLNQAEEALSTSCSELQEKESELQQSEQRVGSIREKLSIAVAKGKGLVVARDSLKQSLTETSNELERCSQELKLKDARLREMETKLKAYAEAGERVEALESELSYIRNSATALRESFLLKDSVLQRIEEILEDLDLPEHFHSQDITEKVDWLARSATGNSMPLTNLDQKNHMGGSYSDTGFVVMDSWKEGAQPVSNAVDDLRRKYEELQGKFYGLAEQNEMLEQSLMERNHLVQRWEQLLDRIDMPSHLQSMEPEDKIDWLGTALLEANRDRGSLEQKIDDLENYCRSLTADLEVSYKKISDLEAELESVVLDREHLSERLKTLAIDHEKLSARKLQFELENQKLHSEVHDLQEKLVEKHGNEESLQILEGDIRRLLDLVSDALPDADIMNLVSVGNNTECLEVLLRKLIENYKSLVFMKPVSEEVLAGDCTEVPPFNPDDSRSKEPLVVQEPAADGYRNKVAYDNLDEATKGTLVAEEPHIASLKKDLEDALHELRLVKEERERYVEKQQSLLSEIEVLGKKSEELQELLYQEEQKSASVREKLNVAVRKGKSLVQHRDSLKQTIEKLNSEMEHMKSEISHRDNALAEYERKIGELSLYHQRVQELNSECLSLRSHLMEAESILQEREHSLSMVLNTLGEIDIGDEASAYNPVEKLVKIGKQFNDLHSALASSNQDLRKSKRAAELLVAELNEVQERNDSLQEELSKSASELAELSEQRDAADAARLEAISHLKQSSGLQYEEKRKQYYQFMILKATVEQLKNGFADINNLLTDVFSKDLEFLHGFEANLESYMKQGDCSSFVGTPVFSASAGITSTNSVNKENFMSVESWSDINLRDNINENDLIEICSFLQQSLYELVTDVGSLKERVHIQSVSLHEEVKNLSEIMGMFCREITSQRESFEVMKRDLMHLKSTAQEKDMGVFVLQNNISVLFEAFANSVAEIEKTKAEMIGNTLVSGNLGMDFNQATLADGGILLNEKDRFSSKELIKSVADRLLLAVREFTNMNAGIVEGKHKEMKIQIADLRKALQEKDIQKDRICMELVDQIKEAEALGRTYKSDLQSSNARLHDLEKKLEVTEEERNLLDQRVRAMEDEQATVAEVHERVRSLTDMLAAKEQEVEALMQALDEEEVQMEDLTNKIHELKKELLQKNVDLENLEASRGKVVKKLSVTIKKFDELHHLSENLLAEVERLQSQLQDRDAEVSFLRQEVTRCTNEVLVASQISNSRDSNEIREFLTWFEMLGSQIGLQDVCLVNKDINQVNEYKGVLQEKIIFIISELEDLRVVAQSRDALLEAERSKVAELKRKAETLEKSLHEKESQLDELQGVGDLNQVTGATTEILEAEPLINKWTAPRTSIPTQVRSLRKVNNDQVAIAIDADPNDKGTSLEEDDDKAHGFKSLTTSRIVPRFTRPVTDMIDGLWVSCDRTLMRQPALRLGIMLYWAVLHALLAAFVV